MCAISICTRRSVFRTAAAVPAWDPLVSQAILLRSFRAMVQREHSADLLRLYENAGARRDDRRDALRDSECELHQVASGAALSGAVHPRERARGARNDFR